MQKSPTAVAAALAEARALVAAGDLERAQVAYLAAEALNPRSIVPAAEWLTAVERAGEPQRYRAELAAVIARYPAVTFFHLFLARLEFADGNREAALAAAAQALATSLKASQVSSLVALLLANRETAAARDAVEQALARFPDAPELLWRRLDVAETPLPPLMALAERKALVDAHPGHPDLQLMLAELATELGDFACAKAMIAALPASDAAGRARQALRRGLLHLAQWRLPEAVAAFTELLSFAPLAGTALENLVRLRLMQGEPAKAKADLYRLFELTRGQRRQRGLSGRPLHSFLGVIITELELRAADIAAVQGAARHSEGAMFAWLKRRSAERPLSLAAALPAVMELRACGRFVSGEAAAARAGAVAIPRRLMQFWDAPEPPEEIARRMDGWRTLNPAFDHVRFNTQTAAEYLARHHPAAVQRAFRLALRPAQKADLLRFAWLAGEGGIYVDADSIAEAPLTEHLPRAADLFLYQELMGTLANDFLAAVPGHGLARAMVEALVEALNEGGGENTWAATGPGLFTRVAITHWAEEDGASLARTVVASRHWLRRFMRPNAPAAYKRGNRHWLVGDFAAHANPRP